MLDSILSWLSDAASNAAVRVVIAAAWLLGGFWIASFARHRVSALLTRNAMGRNGAVLVSRLTSIGVRAIGILFALNALGVSGTGLIAVASAFTVAIGLSLQDVLKNFFSGLYLLLESPFKVGDRIVIKDIAGEVQGIDIRTTHIRNINNELVLIPNATVFTEIVRNDTYFGVRRVDFTIISAERRLEQVEAALHDALDEIDGIRRPIAEPRIMSRSSDGLKLKLSVVVDNTDVAQNRIAQAVIDALPGDTVEVASG